MTRKTPICVHVFSVLAVLVFAPTLTGQTYNVIYNFTGGRDGAAPGAGLTVDAVGNLYGTDSSWLAGSGYGAVFELRPTASGWVLAPLYNFRAGNDGSIPASRVVFGPDGSLYGTTAAGGGSSLCDSVVQGYDGCGTVFRLRPPTTPCATALCLWTETVLYRFTGGVDGAIPYSGDVAFDRLGNIYGTTWLGGTEGSCLFGYHCGTVFKLTRSGSGWNQSVIRNFGGGSDGAQPAAGVIFDAAGNLYGTTTGGGQDGLGSFCYQGQYGDATVYRLTPTDSGWTSSTLYAFPSGTGDLVYSGLIFDESGALYSAGCNGGLSDSSGGFVFKLTPSGSGWTYSSLYNFSGGAGGGPVSSLAMDSAGNLYGTTWTDGAYGYGSVFKLAFSNGAWTESVLHDFTGGADGRNPWCTPVIDADGHIFGTAKYGGTYGYGVIWEVAP